MFDVTGNGQTLSVVRGHAVKAAPMRPRAGRRRAAFALAGVLACLLAATAHSACVTRVEGDRFIFEGCNVEIRNGAGPHADPNGLGNLTVGYNFGGFIGDRASHNVVIGEGHGVFGTTTAGLIAGADHAVGGLAPVALGYEHLVLGDFATAVGGTQNQVWPGTVGASVLGGQLSRATGDWATCDGGYQNEASGLWSWIGGGNHDQATATLASAVGGLFVRATAPRATAVGGLATLADVKDATVVGP